MFAYVIAGKNNLMLNTLFACIMNHMLYCTYKDPNLVFLLCNLI